MRIGVSHVNHGQFQQRTAMPRHATSTLHFGNHPAAQDGPSNSTMPGFLGALGGIGMLALIVMMVMPIPKNRRPGYVADDVESQTHSSFRDRFSRSEPNGATNPIVHEDWNHSDQTITEDRHGRIPLSIIRRPEQAVIHEGRNASERTLITPIRPDTRSQSDPSPN